MTYQLGVDLGTTKTAAAIWDSDQARAVQLGNRATAVPSVVFLRDDGTLLFGEAAQRRADGEPNRSAREFKRRVGDPVPIRLAGTPYTAQQLMALMLAWVIERVTQLEGEPPATVVLTHPANWGPYKRETFLTALRDAGIQTARLVPEPIAAAIHFDSERRVAPGETVAIYDLGGGTFDAAVLRRNDTDFEILGNPGGIDSLGGMEFDDAVLGQVWAAIGGPPQTADPARVAALRREVVDAKEHLSEDLSADIVVDLTEERRSVVIRRSELEELIRPLLDQTVDSLERSFTRSGVDAADLAAVVLVGGSSRIPLVQEVLKSRLGRPVVLDNQPQLAIALGAALSTSLPVDPPTEELPALPLPIQPLPVDAFDRLLSDPLPASPLPAEAPPVEPSPVEPLSAEPLSVEPLPAEPLSAESAPVEQWSSEPWSSEPWPVDRSVDPSADPPVDRADPPTEVFDPPTEVIDPSAYPEVGSGAGPVVSATGRPAILSSAHLPLLLIGTGVAIVALISGINAATSLPGRGGGAEEQIGRTTSTATTDPGLEWPMVTTGPLTIPSRTTDSEPTRTSTSEPTSERTNAPPRNTSRPREDPDPEKTTKRVAPTTDPPEPSDPEPTEEPTEPSLPPPTDQPTEPEAAEDS